jgi:mersacidin/lichenicidin family type 2 lantibiotic
MSNENQKNEKKQPTTPAAQVELTDEELGQVVGGFEPNITNQTTQDADIQKKWLPAN